MFFLNPSEIVVPCLIAADSVAIAHHNEQVPAPGECHIDSPFVLHKTNIFPVVGPNSGDDDDVFLLALKGIDCVDHNSFLEELELCLFGFLRRDKTFFFLLLLHFKLVLFFQELAILNFVLELVVEEPPLALIGSDDSNRQGGVLGEVEDEGLHNLGLEFILPGIGDEFLPPILHIDEKRASLLETLQWLQIWIAFVAVQDRICIDEPVVVELLRRELSDRWGHSILDVQKVRLYPIVQKPLE